MKPLDPFSLLTVSGMKSVRYSFFISETKIIFSSYIMANFKTRAEISSLGSCNEQNNKQLHVNKPTIKRGTYLPPIPGRNSTYVHDTGKYFNHKDSINSCTLVKGWLFGRKQVQKRGEYTDVAKYFRPKINFKAHPPGRLPVFMRSTDTKKSMTTSEFRFRSCKLSQQLRTEDNQNTCGETIVSKKKSRTSAMNEPLPEYSSQVSSNVKIQRSDQEEKNVQLKSDPHQNSFNQRINREVSRPGYGSPDLSQTHSSQNHRGFNDLDNHNIAINAEIQESRTEYQQDVCHSMKNDKDLIQPLFVTNSQTPNSSDYEFNEQCSVHEVMGPTLGPSPKLWDKTSEWKRTNELKWANKNMFGEDVFTEHGIVKMPNHQLKNSGSSTKRRAMKTWGELSQIVSDEEYITTALLVSEFQVT